MEARRWLPLAVEKEKTFMTTLEDLNQQTEDFYNEMKKRSANLKVNSSINTSDDLWDLIYSLEDEVYGETKLDDLL